MAVNLELHELQWGGRGEYYTASIQRTTGRRGLEERVWVLC